jgi:zinc and cadmium transporter
VFFAFFISFLSTLGIGLAGFVVKPARLLHQKLLLAFTGAYLFGITVLLLLPEVFTESYPGIGYWLLAGFVFQYLLEFLSEGIEHGHQHMHQHHAHDVHLPIGLMLGLCIHAFFEGIPMVRHLADGNIKISETLLLGVAVHNIPISLTLVQVLRECGLKNKPVILLLLLFSVMTPLGILAGGYFYTGIAAGHEQWHAWFLAFAIGIFLHISTTILFESHQSHRFNLQKTVVILLGFACALGFFLGGA